MRAKGEIDHISQVGRHGRMIARWLDENGYVVVSITRTRHFKVRLERGGVQRDVMMSSSPKSADEAFQPIRQTVQRTFRAA